MNSVYLKKAKERLLLAKIAVEKQFWSGAVSNCYYALFNLMQAVVESPPKGKWTHGGIPRWFCKVCYEKGLLSERELKGFVRFADLLYSIRVEADYTPNMLVDRKEQVRYLLIKVEIYIEHLCGGNYE
jgi:uncharacterized protein (UPF0332 family)